MSQVRYQVVPTIAARSFHRLPSAVREVVRLCDGTRDLATLTRESELSQGRVVEIVAQLAARKIVVAAAPQPTRRRMTSVAARWVEGLEQPAAATEFSDDEEQFFAKTIEHLIGD